MGDLKTIQEQLIAQIQAQMSDLKKVNTKELGEVIDMVKDIAEAEYYCEIKKQMEAEKEKEKVSSNNNYYYTERYYPTSEYYRDMDRTRYGRMYYPENSNNMSSSGSNTSSSSSNSNGNNNTSYYSEHYPFQKDSSYTERDYPIQLRDEREGKSPMKRKMYMESKSNNMDSSKSMKELEIYMQDLTSDMMELLEKASPEEKAIVQKKINTLASKVQNV